MAETLRGNRAADGVYERLQALADEGHIKLITVWCSEKGSLPDTGHFCGQGTTHLPETFAIVPDPGEGVELKMPEPITFTLPIDPEDHP